MSSLYHCWSDVTLEFHAEEVAWPMMRCEVEATTNRSGEKKEKIASITCGVSSGGPQQMPHCAVSSIGLESTSNNDQHHPYHEAGKSVGNGTIDSTVRRLQSYAFFLTLREPENYDRQGEESIEETRRHGGYNHMPSF